MCHVPHARRSYLPILIALVLILVAVARPNAASNEVRPNQHKEAASKQTEATQQQQPEPTVPLSVYRATESALLEAIRTIHAQRDATAKQKYAQYEPKYAPSNLISLRLLVVGVVYSIFAFRQWAAIKEQARIARSALMANRLALNVSRKSADAARQAADIAEQALYKTQFAIINFEQMGVEAPQDEGKPQFVVVYKNLGPTIAHLLEYSLRAQITNDVPDVPQYLKTESYGDVGHLLKVDAEQREECSIEWPEWCLDDEQRTQLLLRVEEGKWAFLVYGFIIYRDAFDRVFKQGFGAVRYEGKFATLPVGAYKYKTQIEEYQPRTVTVHTAV